MFSKNQSTLEIIKGLKERMAALNATEVANRRGYSRQNLYKHLAEEDHQTANLDELLKIAQVITEMENEKAEKRAALSQILK